MAKINISELHLRVTGSSRGLTRTLRKAGGEIDQFRRQVRSVGTLGDSMANFNGILGRTIALYGVFNAFSFGARQLFDAVKLAADAELAEISLKTLLGSAEAAKTTLEGLYDFVETTPFRLTEVRDSVQLLAAFGVETERLLPTMRSLGDIAAGIGQPVRELADLYGRTLNEQRLYTRDLNQFTSRGIPLIKEFAKTFGVLENEVRGLAEEGVLTADDVTDALARMTAEGGVFFNLTQEQAQTTAGEWSNFLDEVDALKREFGAGLLPVLRDFIAIAREFIGITNNGANTLDQWRQAGEGFADWLRYLAAVFQGMRLVLSGVVQGIAAFLSGLEEMFRALAGLSGSGFFLEMVNTLKDSNQELIRSIRRLTDYDKRLKEVASSGRDFGEGLAEAIDLVPLAVRRAQNQLKRLTDEATKSADQIREKFRTPLEKFRDAAEEIAKARIFGGLGEDVATRALNAEIARLDTAKKELQKVQEAAALTRGSQAEFAARNQRFSRDDEGAETFRRNDLIRIFNDVIGNVRGQASTLRRAAGGSEVSELRNDQKQQSDKQLSALIGIQQAVNTLANQPPVVFSEATA